MKPARPSNLPPDPRAPGVVVVREVAPRTEVERARHADGVVWLCDRAARRAQAGAA